MFFVDDDTARMAWGLLAAGNGLAIIALAFALMQWRR